MYFWMSILSPGCLRSVCFNSNDFLKIGISQHDFFKVNNIPSLYVDPIDDFVNRLMVAEMLNIVGFHIPRAVATRNQEFWKVNFTLDDFDSNNIGHDPKIYSALRTEEDEIKTKRV